MNEHNKLECFVPGRPFYSSIMFASKAKAYLSEATVRTSILGQGRHYPQILDWAGKACQEKTL
jgi:hypothetical protein